MVSALLFIMLGRDKRWSIISAEHIFISEELNHSGAPLPTPNSVTLFEECYLLSFLFIPVPMILMLANFQLRSMLSS